MPVLANFPPTVKPWVRKITSVARLKAFKFNIQCMWEI